MSTECCQPAHSEVKTALCPDAATCAHRECGAVQQSMRAWLRYCHIFGRACCSPGMQISVSVYILPVKSQHKSPCRTRYLQRSKSSVDLKEVMQQRPLHSLGVAVPAKALLQNTEARAFEAASNARPRQQHVRLQNKQSCAAMGPASVCPIRTNTCQHKPPRAKLRAVHMSRYCDQEAQSRTALSELNSLAGPVCAPDRELHVAWHISSAAPFASWMCASTCTRSPTSAGVSIQPSWRYTLMLLLF